MTRGRHQRRRHQQHLQALRDEVQALKVEVTREAEGLAAAEQGAERARAARNRLTLETQRTATALAPHEAASAEAVEAIAASWRDIQEATAELHRVDKDMSRVGRGEHAAAALHAAAASGFRLDAGDLVFPSAPAGYQQIALRKRLGADISMTRTLDLTGWVPAEAGCAREDLAPYARATVHEHDPQAVWAYALPPWTATPTGADAADLRADLGAHRTGAPDLRSGPFPGVQPAPMTIDKPWRHAPLITQPADAVDLAYWYHRSAWAQGWLDDQPVPFWLPEEHATMFPRSKPLPEGTDIRLPFAAVGVMFESSWTLPATKPASEVMHTDLLFARGRAAGTRPARLDEHIRRLDRPRHELPTPLELIEHLGASVEGLIFTADQDNRPQDDFGWCLALRHPWGLPLGRIVVPARRSQTRWSGAVTNLLGGICLSHWHRPERLDPAGSAQTGPLPLPAMASPRVSDVRVLDVGATSPGRDIRIGGRPTSRAPHLRVGTWRWQWVGPGRQRQRPTWVRPTTVRGTGTMVRQVYQLGREP